MSESREPKPGDFVNVVSGPHEGRSGKIIRLHPQSVGMYGEPEWFALLAIKTVDFEGGTGEDEIAVPTRRLKPQ